MDIYHIDSIPENFVWCDVSGFITQSLGATAGSQKLYVNIDTVPPDAYSCKYHSHSQQEEFFLILEGCGVLRLNGVEYPVQKGDFLAKIPAKNTAHQFYNASNRALVILDVGTIEAEDTCYYPDEGIYLQKSNGKNMAFDEQSILKEWSSAPNKRKP